MTRVHQQLKTFIQIVNGPDRLCEKFPKYIIVKIKIITSEIQRFYILLNLEAGQMSHEEKSKRNNINLVCKTTCYWREERIRNICEENGLVDVKWKLTFLFCCTKSKFQFKMDIPFSQKR